MSCFLWHRQHQTLPLRALVLGFWVVLKNWCLITSDYLLSKSGSFWRCSMMSWHICMHCSFWSSYSSYGTIFAQTFQIPKSLVIIFQTLSFFMSSRLAVIQTINQRLCQDIGVHCSLLSVHLKTKQKREELYTNVFKKCKSCAKLRSQLQTPKISC